MFSSVTDNGQECKTKIQFQACSPILGGRVILSVRFEVFQNVPNRAGEERDNDDECQDKKHVQKEMSFQTDQIDSLNDGDIRNKSNGRKERNRTEYKEHCQSGGKKKYQNHNERVKNTKNK